MGFFVGSPREAWLWKNPERHVKWPSHILLHSGALKWDSDNPISHQRGLWQGDPLSSMLFILVMDVLNFIVTRASGEGLLQSLSSRSIQHRVSLYANDIVIFLQPAASSIDLIVHILHLFGEASGHKTNIQMSSVAPIQCSAIHIETVQQHFPCKIEYFPLKYLVLPLSLKKLTKCDIPPLSRDDQS
jgi:hypothetical protein